MSAGAIQASVDAVRTTVEDGAQKLTAEQVMYIPFGREPSTVLAHMLERAGKSIKYVGVVRCLGSLVPTQRLHKNKHMQHVMARHCACGNAPRCPWAICERVLPCHRSISWGLTWR